MNPYTVLIKGIIINYPLDYIIVEKEEMPFMKRFKLSQELTDGFYSTIFLIALLGFILGIGAGILSAVASAPYITSTTDVETTNQANFDNIETKDDFVEAFEEVREEVANQSIDANYVIRQIIAGIFSWGIGLLTIGAFLELYKERRKDLKF